MSEPDVGAQRHGRLIVIGFTDRTAKRALCRCDCGNVREVGVETLRAGEARSCGCAPLSEAEVNDLRRERSERARRIPDWRPGR